MLIHPASWVLPIAAPPIRDGWVAVEEGRIAAVGGPGDRPPGERIAAPPRSEVILPALVNAHTHLELSWMRGRVPPGRSFDDWVRSLVLLRRAHPDPESRDVLDGIAAALEEMRASGTGVVGDISNTLATVPLLERSGLAAHVFHEVLGFNAPDPEGAVRAARDRVNACDASSASVRASLAPHAPYSVSAGLFDALRRDIDVHAGFPSSVHLGESPEEVEFLSTGTGPIRGALDQLGAWNPEWAPPACGPVAYLERCGLLHARMLVVHGVQLTRAEIDRVSAAGATIVTCPRSNRWTGGGTPPIDAFYASGARVAVGTDSLASVEDLNLFGELAAVRRVAPAVSATRILESATRIGAEALGFGETYGTIAPGMRAALIAVRIPSGVTDVEEYLLSGIQPADVRWIEDSLPDGTWTERLNADPGMPSPQA